MTRIPYDPPRYCPHGQERWKEQVLAFTGAILQCSCCGNLIGSFGAIKPGEYFQICTQCQDDVN